jgi:hypothetical protein
MNAVQRVFRKSNGPPPTLAGRKFGGSWRVPASALEAGSDRKPAAADAA